jgi:hypothetical protein
MIFFECFSLPSLDLLVDSAKNSGGASPGFPVEFVGVGELHAAFPTESRTREPV